MVTTTTDLGNRLAIFHGSEAEVRIMGKIIHGYADVLRYKEAGENRILFLKLVRAEIKMSLHSGVEKVGETELHLIVEENPLFINEGGYNCVHLCHPTGSVDLFIQKPGTHRTWD